MFGVGSSLVVAGFLLSQSLVQVVLDGLNARFGLGGELVWLGALARVALWVFVRWNASLAVNSSPSTGAPTANLASRRGLVVLTGLNSDRPDSATARLLASVPSLEYLVLVGTPQTRERKVAQKVVASLLPLAGHRLDRRHVRILTDASADSVSGFEAATFEAVSWLGRAGLAPSDIIVDVSEGRRAMGFGALVAAQSLGVDTQFLANVYDDSGLHKLPWTDFKTVSRHD